MALRHNLKQMLDAVNLSPPTTETPPPVPLVSGS